MNFSDFFLLQVNNICQSECKSTKKNRSFNETKIDAMKLPRDEEREEQSGDITKRSKNDAREVHGLKTHISNKRYICDVCDSAFSKNDHLKTHQRVHSGEKPFVCDQCSTAFSQSCHLKTHKRTHSGEKPFVCDQCSTAFSRSCHLKTHKRTHIAEKPFACNECNSTFSQLSHLKTHKRTHSGEKPFVCNQCNAAFSRSGHLKTHKRTHTAEKPFACNECNSTFARSSSLTTHKRTHSGEKPFVCDVCNAAFPESRRLKVHKKTHSSEKSLVCMHCQFSTTYPSSLKKHLAMHERQKSYKFACEMQDGGTRMYQPGDVVCTIRCATLLDMEYHVQRNHTVGGLGTKLQSETKLAKFFDAAGVNYDRDWTNRLNFKGCVHIEGNAFSARPDFFLLEESARLSAIVLVGNDEFAHRQYPCDLQRVWNIAQSLQQTQEFRDVPLVYVRFNPHVFIRAGVHYDPPLETSHNVVLQTMRSLQTSDVKPGVNLIFINYDQDAEGRLQIFIDAEEEGNDFGQILEPTVLLITDKGKI